MARANASAEEFPTAETTEDVIRNVAVVRARITNAAQRVGRDPDVQLMSYYTEAKP